MILIAPDKYRGTLTSVEAAGLISSNLSGEKKLLPLADGGEGTAQCMALLSAGWDRIADSCYYNRERREMVLDSSGYVGYASYPETMVPTDRTSAPLARALNGLYRKYRPETIYIGIGGTAMCDGGVGFLSELDTDVPWAKILTGLSDVAIPLLPICEGEMSALDFCSQKGFSGKDIETLEIRLKRLVETLKIVPGAFSGAGGGLGYAINDVLGARCYAGAEFLLDVASVNIAEVRCIVTGEGCFDRQSLHGKIAGRLFEIGRRFDIPVYCLAGRSEYEPTDMDGFTVIDTSQFYPDLELSHATAVKRLTAASKLLRKILAKGKDMHAEIQEM